LGILALLCKIGKKGNIGHFDKDLTDSDLASTLFYTWLIYVILTILCSVNLWYRLKHPWPTADEEAEEERRTTIGTSKDPQLRASLSEEQ
jgi:hypothetical protein